VTRATKALDAFLGARADMETARAYELALAKWTREQLDEAAKDRRKAFARCAAAAIRYGYETDRAKVREGVVWKKIEAELTAAVR
jgi:hypothetical protein